MVFWRLLIRFEILVQEHHQGMQIRTDILSVLIWVRTVCKGYQVTINVAASKKRVNILILHFVALLLNAVRCEIEKKGLCACSTKIVLTIFIRTSKGVSPDLFHLAFHFLKLNYVPGSYILNKKRKFTPDVLLPICENTMHNTTCT